MQKLYLLVILFLLSSLPALAAVEPRLAGDWKTSGPDGNEINLHLESNGRYTKSSGGKVIESGEMTAINRNWSSKSDSGLQDNGTFSVVANELVLRSTVNSTLRFKKGQSTLSSSPKPNNISPKYKGQVTAKSTYKTKPTSNYSPPAIAKSTMPTISSIQKSTNSNPLVPSTNANTGSYPSNNISTAKSNPLAPVSNSIPANPLAAPATTSTNTLAGAAKNAVSSIAKSSLSNTNSNSSPATVSGYQRKPAGWQGMAPNKGQRVGTAWGFPNQPGSPNVFGGGLKASIGNFINAAKNYSIQKAINQVSTKGQSQSGQASTDGTPGSSGSIASQTPSTTPLVATNPLAASTAKAPSGPDDIGTPRRKPNSLAKGPVEWDFWGNWSMVDAAGKPTMFHVLEDGRYYITSGGFHVEAGSIKAANGKWALTSQTGRKDSGTFNATDNQLVITSQSAGTSKWSRIGQKMPEPVKKAKSNYKPKRSGFSRTYGGYTEYYGGGRMRHWNRGH